VILETPSWTKPERHPELGGGELHLWRADLRRFTLGDDVLDDDEHMRAARLVKEEHRQRYIAAQSILRHLLSAYSGMAAREVAFIRGSHGKPYLSGSDLQFNITHSHDLLLAAFVQGQEVGIDVERVRPERPVLSLARRYYTPAEVQWLQSLPGADQARSFFRLWTLKESFLKARGTGLSGGLNTFEYALRDEPEPELVWLNAEHGAREDWSSRELDADPDYTSALVLSGTMGAISTFEWI
jgi:4'-phosphopantetheinyl transferase